RLLPADRFRRWRLCRLHDRDNGFGGVGGDRQAVRREQVPGVLVPARAWCRNGRGLGRAVASPYPRGDGVRGGGWPIVGGPLPPEVPRRPLFVGLSGLSRSRGQRKGG